MEERYVNSLNTNNHVSGILFYFIVSCLMVEYTGLGNQFDEIGKTFQGIPHIVLGKDKPIQKPSFIQCPYCFNTIQLNLPIPQIQPIQQVQNNPNKKFTIIDYFKDIGIVKTFLYFCIALVIGYAVYRLIWG